MKNIHAVFSLIALVSIAFLATGCGQGNAGSTVGSDLTPDREYVFESFMTGYVGKGGEIAGKKNPVLTARRGEIIRITIINGEVMPHDIAMKEHGAKSGQIIQKGESTSVTFTAEKNDTYYCTIPGHVQTGMIGEFRILAETGDIADAR